MNTAPFKRKCRELPAIEPATPAPWVSKMIGARYTRLLVVEFVGNHITPAGTKRSYVSVQCDCGNTKTVSVNHLCNGNTKSCGCLHREVSKRVNEKHNHANKSLKGITPTYASWSGMHQRCCNPANKKYYRYGARGIRVCARWKDFRNFLQDMGERLPKTTIDRIINDGNYSCGHCEECIENGWPANCRWASPLQQGGNQSTTRLINLNGELVSTSEAERRLGFSPDSIGNRLRSGWTLERALNTPLKKSKQVASL